MARVLVTGATGFIGHHLVRRLVERGDQVRCLARSLHSKRPMLADAALPSAVECVLGDITVRESLDRAVAGVETVYHLAGATLPIHSNTFWLVNTLGTRNLAESCLRCPVSPTFVYVSSLAAAGPSRDGPLSESCSPCPVSGYGRSKLGAERVLRALAGQLPVTVLRPPCVFGPGEPYLLKLLRLARWGIALRPGHRNFRLSWIYVADLVEAMLLAAEQGRRLLPKVHPEDDTGVYYVALDEQPTIREFANLLAEQIGRRKFWDISVPPLLCWLGASVNDYRTRLTGKPYFLCPDKLHEALAGSWICDAGKAKRELGMVCRTDMRAGLHATVRWYQDQGWF
jgi:nucleoside-diphosphate-sugar epimerase